MTKRPAAGRDAPKPPRDSLRRLLLFAGLPIIISVLVLVSVLLLVKLTGREYAFEVSTYLAWHNLFEFVSAVVSISIFLISWNSYKKTKNLRDLVLGAAFLFIGAVDFMHLLSYQGMPVFITESGTGKAIDYWLAARLVQAGILATFVFIPKKSKHGRLIPYVLLLTAWSSILAVFFVESYFSHLVPTMFVPGEGLTATKIWLEYLVIFIAVFAAMAIGREYERTRRAELMVLISGLIFFIFSELTFTLYASAFDIFNLLGHTFKVASMYFIFLAFFSGGVSRPYEELEESQNKLETIVNASPDGADIVDADLNILWMNKKFREKFRDAAVGKKCYRIYRDDKKKCGKCSLKKTNARIKTHVTEVSEECGDRIFEIRHTGIIHEGKPAVFELFRDITERKAAEAEMKRILEELKELDELKDDFLNTTTHELRTPLIPIKSQAELLLAGDYGELNKEQKEAMDMVLRNAVQMNSLVGDVLDITKVKSNKLKLNLKDAAIGEIVTEAVKDMKDFAKEKMITVVLGRIPELPSISLDKRRITQVISNLLHNALKFTPDKGKVSVHVKKSGNYVAVSVKDSGIGMTEKTLAKLFTPFFQADSKASRKYSGSGLGLPICKGIVEAHGGKIEARSQGAGKGSTFTFSLPLHVA